MKSLTIFLSILLMSFGAQAETCAEKISSMESKIEHAKKAGNKSQLKGLETALSEAKANCTDDKLQAAKNEKIKNKEADVEKARQELEKAKAENKSKKKIAKRQAKLDKEMKELEEVKAAE